MTSAAIRKRRVRAEERDSRKASAAESTERAQDGLIPGRRAMRPSPVAVRAMGAQLAALPEPTMYETEPVAGSGANAFVMSPEPGPSVIDDENRPPGVPAGTVPNLADLGVEVAGSSADGYVPSASPPLVEPEPVPPPPPEPAPVVEPPPVANERAVMMFAVFVAGFFESGIRGMLETSPEFLRFVAGLAGSPEAAYSYIPQAVNVVAGAAAEVARKRNFRGLKYQDEIVVALAVGVGAVGTLRKRRILAAIQQAQDASPAASSPASAPAPVRDPSSIAMPAPAPPRAEAVPS